MPSCSKQKDTWGKSIGWISQNLISSYVHWNDPDRWKKWSKLEMGVVAW